MQGIINCREHKLKLLQDKRYASRHIVQGGTSEKKTPCTHYTYTRSLGALRAPTSRLRPALGLSGLLDNVLHALRALRPFYLNFFKSFF